MCLYPKGGVLIFKEVCPYHYPFNIFLKRKRSHESCSIRSEMIKKTSNVCEIQQMCFRFQRNRLFKIYCRDK